MQYHHILYEKKGGIARVTINRPEVLNALHQPANAEMLDAFTDFRDDPDVLVAIVTGAGDRAFCAGDDLKYPTEHGKPGVLTAAGGGPRFNISHSGDLALFAFSPDLEVGVDVEQVRARPRLDEIAEKYFSDTEAEMVAGLMDEERDSLFATYWTRKEALYKATGTGIANRPAGVDLSGMSADGAEVSCSAEEDADETWFVRDLEVEDGYRAALCCRRRPAVLHCKDAIYD